MRHESTVHARAQFALAAAAVLVGCGPATPAARPTPAPVASEPGAAGVSADAAPAARGEQPAPEPAGLGRSNPEAIEVCKPSGENAYLSRLRCGDGNAPSYLRVGHSGYRTARKGPEDYRQSADQVRTGRPLEQDEADFHPVDQFTVVCAGDDTVHKLYLDMYHCGEGETTAEAPDGFTLMPLPAPPAPASQPTG